MNTISEWAMCNGLVQCMGCKGYDKSEHMIWWQYSNGATFPYCTVECYRSDKQ